MNDDNDKGICCKIKINKNINPYTNQPYTKKEENLKNNLIQKCNKKLGKISPSNPISPINQSIPVNNPINLNKKNKNIDNIITKSSKETIDILDSKNRSPKVKSPKVKKPLNKPKAIPKLKNLLNYNYDDLKKKYKNKIDKKLDTNDFSKFKKKFKIKSTKYVSNLTKDEFIKLINYLNIK